MKIRIIKKMMMIIMEKMVKIIMEKIMKWKMSMEKIIRIKKKIP